MLKKLVLLFLIVFFVSGLVVRSQDVDDTVWQQVTENNYVDFSGVVGTENMYGFTFILKSYNKGQYEPIHGVKIKYTLSQYTIDCLKNKYKIGVMDSYGYNNNFVNGDYNRYATFQPIVKGTAVDAVASKLCRP